MATATADTFAPDIVTHLRIEPGGLDHYLAMVGEDGGNPLVKCLEGSLILVSPRLSHERSGKKIDRLIAAVCSVLGIRCIPCGSTLYRKPGADTGVEPDESYFIQNISKIRGKDDLDILIVPRPDLVVEVVVTHDASHSLAIYRTLGVPEVWIHYVAKKRLVFMRLKRSLEEEPSYVPSSTSLAFPYLTSDDVLPWLDVEDDGAYLQKVSKWVRTVLKPRFAATKKKRRKT